jgi:acyl carrier protein
MATSLKGNEAAIAMTATETVLHEFILKEVLYDKMLPALGVEEPLLASELLDSIAIMQIVAFCEQMFEIVIPEQELLPAHFQSVRAIGQVVDRQLAAKEA